MDLGFAMVPAESSKRWENCMIDDIFIGVTYNENFSDELTYELILVLDLDFVRLMRLNTKIAHAFG